MKRSFLALVAWGLVLMLAACAGRGGGSNGTLEVRLADAGLQGVDEAWVTITQVDVCGPNGWWTIFPADDGTPREVNVAALRNSATLRLATASLPPGLYRGLRLILAQGPGCHRVVTAAGECRAEVAPAAKNGVEVLHDFTIRAGETCGLTVDFDLAESLRRVSRDGFCLRPQLRLIETDQSGAIEGVVTDGAGTPLPGVSVMAQEAGQDSATGRQVTQMTTTDPDGHYSLGALPPGGYTAVVVPGEGQPYAIQYRDVAVPGAVLVDKVNFTLKSARLVELRGVAALAGSPRGTVPEVAVFLGGLWVEVCQADVWAEDGSFSLVLPAGSYDVMFAAEGYETLTQSQVSLNEPRRLAPVTLSKL